jgi:hypothetical protein
VDSLLRLVRVDERECLEFIGHGPKNYIEMNGSFFGGETSSQDGFSGLWIQHAVDAQNTGKIFLRKLPSAISFGQDKDSWHSLKLIPVPRVT